MITFLIGYVLGKDRKKGSGWRMIRNAFLICALFLGLAWGCAARLGAWQ